MAIRHPSQAELARCLADEFSLEQRCVAIREAYDLANLQSAAERSASLVGELYSAFRKQKKNDNEAMRLVDLTLRYQLTERDDIKEKFSAMAGAKLEETLQQISTLAIAVAKAKAAKEKKPG